MFKYDYHIHSEYSFDSESKLDDICEKAIELGLSEIAITDHIDCNAEKMGLVNAYDGDRAEEAVLEAKEKYAEKIKVIYGAELGQPAECPDFAENILSKHDFEFVLGSVHNLPDNLDFYCFDYGRVNDRELSFLFGKYIEELKKTILFGGIDSMAHLTYPLRYIREGGRELDLSKFEYEIDNVLYMTAERNMALEINVSGVRRKSGTLPEQDIVNKFVALGGRYITLGSDAHGADVVGADIDTGLDMVKAAGLDSVAVMRDGKLTEMKIS